jgi:hypothetical protein
MGVLLSGKDNSIYLERGRVRRRLLMEGWMGLHGGWAVRLGDCKPAATMTMKCAGRRILEIRGVNGDEGQELMY